MTDDKRAAHAAHITAYLSHKNHVYVHAHIRLYCMFPSATHTFLYFVDKRNDIELFNHSRAA